MSLVGAGFLVGLIANSDLPINKSPPLHSEWTFRFLLVNRYLGANRNFWKLFVFHIDGSG